MSDHRSIWPAAPALAVAAQAVTATGMTPGGDVVWLALMRKVVECEASYGRFKGVVHADVLDLRGDALAGQLVDVADLVAGGSPWRFDAICLLHG